MVSSCVNSFVVSSNRNCRLSAVSFIEIHLVATPNRKENPPFQKHIKSNVARAAEKAKQGRDTSGSESCLKGALELQNRYVLQSKDDSGDKRLVLCDYRRRRQLTDQLFSCGSFSDPVDER